jgi:hypothetical protein
LYHEHLFSSGLQEMASIHPFAPTASKAGTGHQEHQRFQAVYSSHVQRRHRNHNCGKITHALQSSHAGSVRQDRGNLFCFSLKTGLFVV